MNEKKLKNFLVNGFQALDRNEEEDEEFVETEETTEADETAMESEDPEPTETQATEPDEIGSLADLEREIIRIRYMLEDMKEAGPAVPDMSAYMTTREQFKAVTAAVEKRDAEMGEKSLVRAMEAISVMREDFFKLCQGMRGRINDMSAETVLSSFEAYSVDMENILTDGGVYIGPFPYEKLNTLHQRIVGVVPTGDSDKDGMISERLSDGYKFGDRVLLKEKVKVYKYDPAMAPPVETASETDSETSSDTGAESAAEGKQTENQEEDE